MNNKPGHPPNHQEHKLTQEELRLEESHGRSVHWKRWGPYLSERQWGTVREDYSPHGTAWEYLPHDHARSRAYRWGEDGLGGFCDRHQFTCFALALWNGRDPILKERLFGLSGNEGNHGEDVKEYYFYLDSTPTHSYMKFLYKYPQAEFPYTRLVEENRRRDRHALEYELMHTGAFNDDRYFDVFVEYAKASHEDILIKVTVHNRGPEPAELHLLPTLWFRNTWSWGVDDYRPQVAQCPSPKGTAAFESEHKYYGKRWLVCHGSPELLFTENETNMERLFAWHNRTPYVKDAFHRYVIEGAREAVNPAATGTKAAAHYKIQLSAGGETTVCLRFTDQAPKAGLFAREFEDVFTTRIKEADEFYAKRVGKSTSQDAISIQRQAFGGLLWSKQFYHYDIRTWLEGDPAGPPPPPERWEGRNHDWTHLYNADVISMPDKWEYPWYATWDLAFHCVAMSLVDSDYAKEQLVLMLREWYMHPSGQVPAYEWAFDDVNPPLIAWAAFRVYKIERRIRKKADRQFLEKIFHKLLLNFTWWVNRKDPEGLNVFQGGFLGLDNIGVFDRSKPLPTGGNIEQSDGTSWMAMYSLNLMAIALELAKEDRAYEDVASKFFEHFAYIVHAMNDMGGHGMCLWDDQDGFYYDVLHLPNEMHYTMRVRSMVGLIPLLAVETLEPEMVSNLSGFNKRMQWFIQNVPHMADSIDTTEKSGGGLRRLLSIVNRERLIRMLRYMLDESEFFAPYGIRALSKFHREHPYVLYIDGHEYRVDYEPAESTTGIFGGNSNWRGPIWFPLCFLLVESLQKFHHYYGHRVMVECPTGSGQMHTLWEVAAEISRRMTRIFLRGKDGRRPVYGGTEKYQSDPHWRDHILFYEYFHGDNGAGLGASHQTGWTSLVAKLLEQSGG
jgi:Mannosylglycerate hydrolase MGH1-like glycoside hydrolase domain